LMQMNMMSDCTNTAINPTRKNCVCFVCQQEATTTTNLVLNSSFIALDRIRQTVSNHIHEEPPKKIHLRSDCSNGGACHNSPIRYNSRFHQSSNIIPSPPNIQRYHLMQDMNICGNQPKSPTLRLENIPLPHFNTSNAEGGTIAAYPWQTNNSRSHIRKFPYSSSVIEDLNNNDIIGHPSLQIRRFRLPPHLLKVLDRIVSQCEQYAATQPGGWKTELYSLTKQDIALRAAPHIFKTAKPISMYIKRAMCAAYGVQSLKVDKNQPHVLKYSVNAFGEGHSGVNLHHDKSDFTANLMMSRSSSYHGGGTHFLDANEVVKLEFGEFLLHPGHLVHGGVRITRGTRYLMVIFARK